MFDPHAACVALSVATPHARGSAYLNDVSRVGEEDSVDPLLLVAIMERESACGTSRGLDQPGPAGRGDGGHGRGLMQLDDRVTGGQVHGAIIADGRWADPYWNIKAAVVDHLKPDLRFFEKKGLTGDALLRAAVAAYNTGAGNVWRSLQAGKDPDATTAGGNYSADVLSRYAALSQAYRERCASNE